MGHRRGGRARARARAGARRLDVAGSACGSRAGRSCSASCRCSSSSAGSCSRPSRGTAGTKGRSSPGAPISGSWASSTRSALWHGVLAFGFGLVLGSCLDAVPAAGAGGGGDDRRRRTSRSRPTSRCAEQREAAHNAEPHLVTVGPARRPNRTQNGGRALRGPQSLTQGSCVSRVRVDRSSGMNAVPHQRGLALLVAHCASLDPDSPNARERLDAGARAGSRAQARVRRSRPGRSPASARGGASRPAVFAA